MSNTNSERRPATGPLSCAVIIPTSKEFEVIVPAIQSSLSELTGEKLKRITGRKPVESERIPEGHVSFKTDQLDYGENRFRVGYFCATEMGNTASAATTAYVLAQFKPSLMISAGIAGSMNPLAARLGDVIIPHEVRYLSYNKVGDAANFEQEQKKVRALEPITMFNDQQFYFKFLQSTETLRNPNGALVLNLSEIFEGFGLEDAELQEAIQISLEKNGIEFTKRKCRIHRDDKVAIFSWEKVLDSLAFYDGIERRNVSLFSECSAVDMESYGFMKTINIMPKDRRPEPLIVRGISDYVGLKHVTDQKQYSWRKHAMRNVGSVIGRIIRQRVIS